MQSSTVSSSAGRAGQQARTRRGVPRVGAQVGDPVVGVDEDDARGVVAQLGLVVGAVGDQDDQVTGVHQVRGGAVDADHPGAGLAGDHVGLQAGTVGDVDDADLLALEQVGGRHEVGVDGDRADVVQV